MPLWTHELLHFSIYAVFYFTASLYYKPFRNPKYFMVGFFSAVLIDLDHVLDYLLFNHFSTFNLFKFLSCDFYTKAGVAYVFFHGWEYLLLVLLFAYLFRKTKWVGIFLVFALGMFAHLLFDTFINGLPGYFYFISLRAAHGFSLE